MKLQRELPIAPRPEDDELLSSWQGRVACHYGLTHDDLSRWLGVLDEGRHPGFVERDFLPSAEIIRAWANACRLSVDRVQSLALSSRPRSRSWYVWGEGRAPGAFLRPFCPACLDEDAAAGRDHYFRRSWALVETLICDRHHCVLEEACPHCLRYSGFRFVFHGYSVQLVCVECGRPAEMAHSKRRRGSVALLATTPELVAAAIADQPAMMDRMIEVARLLWKPPNPRTGRRIPFVAVVLPDLRLPPSVQMRVDQVEPLATARIGWRMVTLLGVAVLLELGGARKNPRRLTFTIDQIVAWTEEPRPPRREKEARALGRLLNRSNTDYLTIARSLMASEEWRAVQGGDPRTQRRVLNALINKALSPVPRVSL